MYKAEVINNQKSGHWISKHKVGEIIEFADGWMCNIAPYVKVIEHYRMVTKSKTRCPHCNQWIIKREKEVIEYGTRK